MSAREILVMAAIYTLTMTVAVSLVDWSGRAGIVLAVANVWFWIGRMTARKAEAA